MQNVELTPEQWTLVERLSHEDVNRLRLAHHGDKAMARVIDQIECRQRAAKKLSETLASNPRFIFPSVLASEQATSDSLASFHASLIPDGSRLLEMTCGLGIDAFHCAAKAAAVEAHEINELTALCARHNANGAGLKNISLHCGDSVKRLKELEKDSFDCIFIDPARRGAFGKRLFALSECEPDVTALLPRMLEIAPRVFIKASPMLDITHTAEELGSHVSHIIAIGDRRECKELVIICDRGEHKSPAPEAITMNGHEVTGEWRYTREEEETAQALFGEPLQGGFLYEPFPATLKSGGFKLLSARFGINKIAPNSHLYCSTARLDNFPGERFRILEYAPFNKKTVRELRERYDRLDISTRNFPMKPDEITARIKIKGGGTNRLFATRDAANRAIVIVVTKDLD